jgi:hypothetical protein
MKDQPTTRPLPPEGMGEWSDDARRFTASFVPALDMPEWVKKTFIEEDAALLNVEHQHLNFADIAFLWAAGGFTKQMRRVIGQTEEVTFRCGPWQKGRQEQQMVEWFGRVPGYLITLDADYCAHCSDAEFCALVEHELYHIGQEKDAFGMPRFTKDGFPKLTMRGHDVEEFIGVVRRYGVGAPDGALAKMLEAGRAAPEVGRVSIAHACGTCLLKAA